MNPDAEDKQLKYFDDKIKGYEEVKDLITLKKDSSYARKHFKQVFIRYPLQIYL